MNNFQLKQAISSYFNKQIKQLFLTQLYQSLQKMNKTEHLFSQTQIKQALIGRKIFLKQLPNAKHFINLKKFMENQMSFILLKCKQTQAQQAIKIVFKTLDKNISEMNDKFWIKAFAAHAFLQIFLQKSFLNEELYLVLLRQVERMLTQLEQDTKQQNSSFLKKSLEKVKRSLSKKGLKMLFSSDSKAIATSDLNTQNLAQSILIQYLLYIKKLIIDREQVANFYKKKQFCSKKYEVNSNLSKQEQKIFVWKIINLFKKISKIIVDYKRSGLLIKSLNYYTYSMINFFCIDGKNLYTPMIKYLKSKTTEITQKQHIKNCKSIQINQISESEQRDIIQLKTMIQQFDSVNQCILYIFNGQHHFKQLYDHVKPREFTSINDKCFDRIYDVFGQISSEKKRGTIKNSFNQDHKHKNLQRQSNTINVVKFKQRMKIQMNSIKNNKQVLINPQKNKIQQENSIKNFNIFKKTSQGLQFVQENYNQDLIQSPILIIFENEEL